jgi:hypothetical protein
MGLLAWRTFESWRTLELGTSRPAGGCRGNEPVCGCLYSVFIVKQLRTNVYRPREYPGFLSRITGQYRVCGFHQESGMKVINATNLDRKPGVSTDLDLMRAATFMRFVITCAVCLLSLLPGRAQESTTLLPTAAAQQTAVAAAAIPDAPTPAPMPEGQQDPSGSTSSSTAAANSQEPQQTKRILWIMPNFRAVNAGVKLPPQSVKEKLKTGALDSFDYSSFIFVGIQAGISQATDAYPAFRQGAAGYGRYYWHTFADNTDENLWVEGILPIVLHQDSRYYTLGHGGIIKRGFYAVTRTMITRTDSGRETFNASEIFGSGAAAAISSAYYPTQYRTWTKIGQRWLTNALLDFGTFAAKEFWPDVNHAIFHESD